jgi:hypothetical protein
MLLRLLAGSSHSAAFLHTVQLLLRGRPNGVHAVMRGFRRLVSHNSKVHGAIEKPDRGHTSPCGTPARATQRSLGMFSGLTQKRGRRPMVALRSGVCRDARPVWRRGRRHESVPANVLYDHGHGRRLRRDSACDAGNSQRPLTHLAQIDRRSSPREHCVCSSASSTASTPSTSFAPLPPLRPVQCFRGNQTHRDGP